MLDYALLDRTAKAVGDSYYIFWPEKLLQQYQRFQTAFSQYEGNLKIAYALKANYSPFICRELHRCGAFAEVCNRIELSIAMMTGFRMDHIIINGPGITLQDFCDTENWNQCLIHVDSIEALNEILSFSQANPNVTIRVGLRLFLRTRRGCFSRFGIELSDEFICFLESILKQHPNIRLEGIHCHIKGRKPLDWREKVHEMIAAYVRLQTAGIECLSYIDFGGGFPLDDWEEMQIIVDDIISTIKNQCQRTPVPAIIVEPGAELVANCMSFASRVKRTKQLADKHYAIIRASRFHVEASTKNRTIECQVYPYNNEQRSQSEYCIAGSTCMEDDVIAVANKVVKTGDYLLFENVGAYVSTLIPQFGFEQFAVVSYENERCKLVRKPESTSQAIMHIDKQ